MNIELFSSGTTNKPKRISEDWNNILASAKTIKDIYELKKEDVVLNCFDPKRELGFWITFASCLLTECEMIMEYRNDVTVVAGYGFNIKQYIKGDKLKRVVIAKGTAGGIIIPKGIKMNEIYGSTEYGKAWTTCDDVSQGYHIDDGKFFEDNGLLYYNKITVRDYGTLTSEPCPACGFKGQRVGYKITRGEKPQMCG